MGWTLMFAGRRFTVGMWRWADGDADGTAYGNAGAHTGYQYANADISSANTHPGANPDTRPHSDSYTGTYPNAGAGWRPLDT